MTALVLDGSVTLAWLLPDEASASAILDRVAEEGASVPGIWPIEVANGLLMAERRRRIQARWRAEALEILRKLPIVVDQDTVAHAWSDSLALARAHALSLYDACYLELARRLALPLATLDRELDAAARAIGVEVLGS